VEAPALRRGAKIKQGEDMAIGRSDYEERKERKIEHFNEQAEKAQQEAAARSKRARDIGGAIPLGQPILVGHHSERRHRADLQRMDTEYRKSAEALDRAEHYGDRAEAMENNSAISGDDPEAVTRYREKLAELEDNQKAMKAMNAYWRKHRSMKGYPGLSDETAAGLDEGMKKAYSWVQRNGPCEDWRLKNNNAEIRRIKEKLETLARLDNMDAETIAFNGGELRVNVEINRVQFVFCGKPPEEKRALLKAHGFRWAPSEGAWQRQRTLAALRVAKSLVSRLEA